MTNGEPVPEPTKAGAAGSNEPTPTPTPATPKVEPKFEAKEGSYFVDGKKMVAESDLIAAKRSLEGQLETQQTAHTQAVDTVNLELSDARKQVADLNAKVTEAQGASGQGATSDEDVARIKQEREDALSKVETLTTEAGKALELRRALLVTQYPGVTAESLADKDMKALDFFEEALKAVVTSRGGVGQYAIGGGLGGSTPKTNMERATEVIANTPIRGVRTAESGK